MEDSFWELTQVDRSTTPITEHWNERQKNADNISSVT